MANSLLDKVPQALKSMYYAENELRRALFKGVVLRTEEAREHLAQARRHLDDMLGKTKPEQVNPPGSHGERQGDPAQGRRFLDCKATGLAHLGCATQRAAHWSDTDCTRPRPLAMSR